MDNATDTFVSCLDPGGTCGDNANTYTEDDVETELVLGMVVGGLCVCFGFFAVFLCIHRFACTERLLSWYIKANFWKKSGRLEEEIPMTGFPGE
jgi:hypothetical protein